ncbi:MAG TPA: protein kinase [Planctomycetota bacterium]|nr:protein kinase [Planctomycetota bacterium]
MTTHDPDEDPTRIGSSDGRRGGAGAGSDADATVPSLPAEERTVPSKRPDDPTVPSMRDEERTAPSKRAEERTVPAKRNAAAPKSEAGKAPKPGAAPAAKGARDSMIGKELGGCRIDSLLGRGAMGAVYKARQLRLDRDVAIKIIRPEMMTDQRMLKRFQVEARIVGQFNSQHVVMVHDVGFELGVHYLVMEFVQGKNLRDHVKLLAGGRLPAGEAIPLLRQACKGLEEAQRLAVIHRDIKPDNLMLTDRGVLKIADFGIAKPVQADFNMTMTSELIGTPLYMSPEQCRGGEDLDFRSDMYSLGATFYYLLTGEPPIRASSVYELIQTKTKLENLCLWKALPELDENHPLSRVIERMTALDREDRYDSYEGLLNDIVLVEQGSTIERLMKKPKAEQPKRLAPPKKKSRAPAVLAALVLVAAAGGGYWWATRDDGGGSGGPDANRVAAQLVQLRSDLAQYGPSSKLRGEVARVVPDESHRTDTSNLLDDVDRGLPVLAALAALVKPAELVSPFDDLRGYFRAVDEAIKVRGTPGKELQQWLDKAKRDQRAEAELGPKAQSKLQATFQEWLDDRAKVETDKEELRKLGDRLADIRKGRQTLWDELPDQRAALDRVLSTDRLDKERLALTNPTPRRPVVDEKLIAGIRQQLAEQGWDKALDEKASQLDPTVPEQNQLLKDIGNAKLAADEAQSVYTNRRPPELPFDNVDGYLRTLRQALDPLGETLPPWAENLLARRKAELWPAVLEACQDEFTALKTARTAAGGDPKALAARVGTLRRGITRAGELFPDEDKRAELARLVPAEEVAAIGDAAAERAKSDELLAAVQETRRMLGGVRSLGDWTAKSKAIVGRLDEQRKLAQALGNDAEIERELKECEALRDGWKGAADKVADCVAKIAAGNLSGAIRVSADGEKGGDEIALLRAVARKCEDAFRLLDGELEVEQAHDALEAARRDLRPRVDLAAAADDRIKQWSDALAALASEKGDMVRIAGGTDRLTSRTVPSFFLSRYEERQSDYKAFLDAVAQYVASAGSPAAELDVLKGKIGAVIPTPDLLASMLKKRDRLTSPDLPVDEVCYHEAAACAAWYHKALPTKAEWALAAFGPAPGRTYPWGDEFKVIADYFNVRADRLVDANQGGKSWRSGESIHHLAGNVSEWLQAAAGEREADLAGGCFRDSVALMRSLAQGKDWPHKVLSRNDQGFGFRLVLRPREYLMSRFPSGRFPPAN